MVHKQKFIGLAIFPLGSAAVMGVCWMAFARWEDPLVRWMIGRSEDFSLVSTLVREAGNAVIAAFFGGWAISVLAGCAWLAWSASVKVWTPGGVAPAARTYRAVGALGLILVGILPLWLLGYRATPLSLPAGLSVGGLVVFIHAAVNWGVAVPLCTCRPLKPAVPFARLYRHG